MIVDSKMAVHTVHTFFEMDVFEVNCLLKAVWIFKIDLLPVFVEQVSFSVALKDRFEDPSMTVVVSKLGVLQLGVKFADLGQKITVSP